MKKRIFLLLIISMFTFASCGSNVQNEEKTDYDVIVIGAGGGGLSAASKLSMEKKKVLLIEQHSKVGGYMGSFKRGDYTFEISLHSMDGLEPGAGRNIKVFKDAGIYDKSDQKVDHYTTQHNQKALANRLGPELPWLWWLFQLFLIHRLINHP